MKLEFIARGSPDCPLIRLHEFSELEARQLREIAAQLSSGALRSVALQDCPGITPVGGCRLELRLEDQDWGIRRAGPSCFQWILTAQGWKNVEGLLGPFCETDHRGSQWLTSSGDASVLVSRDGRW